MSKKKIGISNWWEHVGHEWYFLDTPETYVYPVDSENFAPKRLSSFRLTSTFSYYCVAHDDFHQRQVEGFRPADLAEALNAVSPEICYVEVLRYVPHPNPLASSGYHLHLRDDIEAIGYSMVEAVR